MLGKLGYSKIGVFKVRSTKLCSMQEIFRQVTETTQSQCLNSINIFNIKKVEFH